jgi:hypothetical protein
MRRGELESKYPGKCRLRWQYPPKVVDCIKHVVLTLPAEVQDHLFTQNILFVMLISGELKPIGITALSPGCVIILASILHRSVEGATIKAAVLSGMTPRRREIISLNFAANLEIRSYRTWSTRRTGNRSFAGPVQMISVHGVLSPTKQSTAVEIGDFAVGPFIQKPPRVPGISPTICSRRSPSILCPPSTDTMR